MPSLRNPVRAVLLVAVLGVGGTAPSAGADEPLTTVIRPTAVHADAGVTVWTIPTSGNDRLVVRYGTDAPFTTAFPLHPGTPIDVGTSPSGGARVVFADDCSSRRRRCNLRVVELGRSGSERKRFRSRLLTRILYRGGGAPAVTAEGARIAYTAQGSDRVQGRRVSCDVPFTRRLGSRPSKPKRLDRGVCAQISQLDLEDGRIAALAHPQPDIRHSEARVLRIGGGRSRTLQIESQGEEPNFIGQVALDRGSLYTSLGGIRQGNRYTRYSLRTGRRTQARAFTTLIGGFARDRGRQTYLEGTSGGFTYGCRADVGISCRTVDGGDPFAPGSRLLAPRLTIDIQPAPLYADQTARGVGTLSRKRVTRTTQLGVQPVAGVKVELVRIDATGGASTRHPTGAMGTTDPDGRFDIVISSSPPPRLVYGAVTRPTLAQGLRVVATQASFAATYVRMTVDQERLPDGRIRLTGTISPAQTGRKVRLDRRVERVCNKGQLAFPARPSPSSIDSPPGCVDRYTEDPVATAPVSGDGSQYALEAPAKAGIYRVSLDFAGGAEVYAGQTAPFEVR